MKRYDIIRSKEILKIRRRKSVVVFQLAFLSFFVWPIFAIPIAGFLYHSHVFLSVVTIIMEIPLLLVFFRDSAYLPNKEIILDKTLGEVIINGRSLSPLIELRAVNLGSYLVPTAKDQPYSRSGLYFLTAAGTAIEIERAVNPPSRRAIKEVGLAIADFLNIHSNIS